jgi:uncharacterized protein
MGSTHVLVVFLREPIPGRVKTRLAASVGADVACDVYRALASHVVDAVRTGPWHTQFWVDVADGVEHVRQWLGTEPLVQQGDDLGARMRHAVAMASGPCVVIGTDAPDVDASVIADAFVALEHADVVVGPAYDGGYYLIGLRRPLPALFTDVAWGTERVLQQTLERAVIADVSVHVLSPLRDIDTFDDLQSYIATHADLPLASILRSITPP